MASLLFSLKPERSPSRQLVDPEVFNYTLEDEYHYRQSESDLQDAVFSLESISHRINTYWSTIANMETALSQITPDVSLESASLNLDILSFGLINSTTELSGYSMESIQEFSLESIAATAKKIVDTIIKWLSNIVKWILDFFKNIFSAIGSMSRKVTQVQRAAMSIKSDTKPSSDVIAARHMRHLHINGEYLGYSTLHTGITRVGSMLDTVLDTFQDRISDFYSDFNATLNDSTNGMSHLENVDDFTKKDILRSILDQTQSITDRLLDMVQPSRRNDPTEQFSQMPGGYTLVEKENTIVVHNKNEIEEANVLSGTHLNYQIYHLHTNVDLQTTSNDVPTLTKDECLSLLSEVTDVIASMQDAKRTREELSKRIDGVRKALSDFTSSIRKAYKRDNSTDDAAERFVDITVRQYTQLATQRMELSLIQMDHYCYRVVKAVLDNVIQSLKLYDTSSRVTDDTTNPSFKSAPALR